MHLPSDNTVPSMVFGTAWKKDRTQGLVTLALSTGFRGVDTANDKAHYEESLVGEGIAKAMGNGIVRDSLWVCKVMLLRTSIDPC